MPFLLGDPNAKSSPFGHGGMFINKGFEIFWRELIGDCVVETVTFEVMYFPFSPFPVSWQRQQKTNH